MARQKRQPKRANQTRKPKVKNDAPIGTGEPVGGSTPGIGRADPAEEEAFLRAIMATDEDVARLVYADWLDEHGWPVRAELIRVQCALVGLAETDTRYQILKKREAELLGTEWSRSISLSSAHPCCAGWYPNTDPGIEGLFRRGLIDEVSTGSNVKAFLSIAPALFAVQPVRRLTFNFCQEWSAPGSGGGGDDVGSMPPAELTRLAAFPALARVRHLGLHCGYLDAAAATALVPLHPETQLTSLGLVGCEFSPDGLSILLAAPWAARLEVLDLHGVMFTRYSMAMGGPDVSNGPLSADVVAAIGSAKLPVLHTLDLSCRRMTPEVTELLRRFTFPALRELRTSRPPRY